MFSCFASHESSETIPTVMDASLVDETAISGYDPPLKPFDLERPTLDSTQSASHVPPSQHDLVGHSLVDRRGRSIPMSMTAVL